MQAQELRPGDRFRVAGLDCDELELLKLTPCRALVRPTPRVHREVTTWKGERVRFTVPQPAFSVSVRTDIETQ